MTFAAALLAALIVVALAALAARRTGAGVAWRWMLLAALAPLGAAWLIAGRAPAGRAAYRAQLVGQYAPLRDTLRIGGAGADVRAAAPDERPLALRAAYDASGDLVTLHVDSASGPIFAADAPVNALPLGRRAEVRVGGTRPLRIGSRTPRWPLGCLLHVERLCGVREWRVESGGRTRTVRVPLSQRGVAASSLGEPLLARLPVTIFLHDGAPWIAATPGARVTVNDVAVPSLARAPAPLALRIGTGASAVTATLAVDRAGNGLHVRFGRRLAPSAWPLDARSGTPAMCARAAPATASRRSPALCRDWRWVSRRRSARARNGAARTTVPWSGPDGRGAGTPPDAVRALTLDTDHRLPGLAADERGHLVQLSAADQTANPLPLLTRSGCWAR